MYRNTATSRHKADHFVSRYGITAPRIAHGKIMNPFYNDARLGFPNDLRLPRQVLDIL